MEEKRFNTPANVLEIVSGSGVTKAERPVARQLLLAFAAGAFIAFASEGSTTAAFNLLAEADTYGLGRYVASIVFGTGLMLVIIAGGELFTGNTMMLTTVLDKKIKPAKMFKNWLFVYAGNLLGALFIVVLMRVSGLLDMGGGLLGGVVIKIAYGKVSLSFLSAFASGIMCNWLVCLAVWCANAAKDITGKILSIFFIISLFITSGFEHCVANMYYVPAGLLAKSNPLWAARSGLLPEQLAELGVGNFILNNLLPVTLGNIVGGAILTGGLYWLAFRKKAK